MNYNKKNSFNRPQQTFTDKLTPEEIAGYLEDYEEVKNLDDLKVGTHVRYFIVENNMKKFRLGGYCINNKPDYIVLCNKRNKNDKNNSTWSVQKKNCIIYKQMTISDLREEYDTMIQKFQDKLNYYKQVIEEKNQEIEELKLIIKKSKIRS